MQVSLLGNGTTTSPSGRKSKNTTGNLPLNEWIYVTSIVHSIDSISIFFDTELQEGTMSGSAQSFVNGTGNAMIGASANAPYTWKGKLDEVRLYNRALTLQDIDILSQKRNLIVSTETTQSVQQNIIVYPNPANDYIILNTEREKYNIINLQGKIVLSGDIINNNTTEISIIDLTPGHYIVQVINNNKTYQQHFYIIH